MSVPTAQLPLEDLRNRVAGRVITPDDEGYDEARGILYNHDDLHPAAVIRVANAQDVAAVVDIARESGLELAVRSGGHSGAGHSTTDGGLVIDLREMKKVDVDPASRTAWAEAGATAADVATAADAHGLAVGFGDTGSVGIGGITTGGGIGYLTRKHGLTIDSVIAADVVTADGKLRRVDANTEPDLFWAIRGGGGNVGVVTRFQYRLHEARRRLRRDALPAGDGRHDRRLHRGRRRGARGAGDDRERHELPADAVRPRGAPRLARSSWA